MKWIVTGVVVSRHSRRRMGKSFTIPVESEFTNPQTVEEKFQRQWIVDHPEEECKIIDVRPAKEEVSRA